MNRTLKSLSVLLGYPSAELQAAIPEIRAAVHQERALSAADRRALAPLLARLERDDLYDLQEHYSGLFDASGALSLHLFEHVHGESRDRGQAMVDLAQMYERQGFEIDANELPDYLPLFLEYLSTQSPEEVHNLLGQTLHIIAALRERLQKRDSIYANALLALEAISGLQADAEAVQALLETPEHDPLDLEALDEVWAEEAVTFGGNAGDGACGPDRLRTQIRAHQRPAPQPKPIGAN
jgi:nitrate reductase molybdenum cofactor assembly chaperone NarJ/NarW